MLKRVFHFIRWKRTRMREGGKEELTADLNELDRISETENWQAGSRDTAKGVECLGVLLAGGSEDWLTI